MNGKQIYRSLVLFGAACCLSASLSGVAQGVQMVLHASLKGNDHMAGKVQYVLHDSGDRTLGCFITGAKPGQALVLCVRRNREEFMLDWCRVNRRGQATMELSTVLGHHIPLLQAGDFVDVWTMNRVCVLTGRLE